MSKPIRFSFRTGRACCLLLLVLFIGSGEHFATLADIPRILSYHGHLTDTNGVPIQGTRTLTFRLYDAREGGAPKGNWEESHQVRLEDGQFHVLLGSLTPFAFSFDQPCWLGVTVDGGSELMPRSPLAAAPYSLGTQWSASGNDIYRLNGNVGIGTTTPTHKLHVVGLSPQLRLSTSPTNGGLFISSFNPGEYAISGGAETTNGATWIARGNTGKAAIWDMQGTYVALYQDKGLTDGQPFTPTHRLSIVDGNVGIEVAVPVHPLQLASGAHVTAGGVWTNASGQNLKENFAPIDGGLLLEQLDRLPISMWNYKAEGENVKHVGPTAQDFYRVFGLGHSDTSISTIDPAGIALAAVQELSRKNEQLDAENEALRTRLDRLESLVESLAEKLESDPQQLSR